MIIFRYLSKEVCVTLVAITLVLLVIFISDQFVHYLNDAARGLLTMQVVLEIMLLEVPMLLGYLLPLGLFLGILLTFGRLYSDHEMVVMSACGVSRLQIVGVVMMVAAVLSIIVAWLMLVVEPKTRWYRGEIINNLSVTATIQRVLPGRFQPLYGGDRVFYAESVDSEHNMLKNVFLATKMEDKNKTPNQKQSQLPKWDIVAADRAFEEKRNDGLRYLVFANGHRYVGVPGQKDYQETAFKRYGLRLTANPPVNLRYDAMPTLKLWQKRHENLRAIAELQWRFAMPLSTLVFALLAVPLSYVNPRKGKFAQMLPALLIYVIYVNLMFTGRTWIEKGVVSPEIGLWWIFGALSLLAILLYIIQVGWRRFFYWVSD